MNVLLIQTAAQPAWIALSVAGRVHMREVTADKLLGINLLPAIDEVLKEGDATLSHVDRIAAHAGPGHYSRLRTGITTATTLAAATDTPLSCFATTDVDSAIQAVLRGAEITTIEPRYE